MAWQRATARVGTVLCNKWRLEALLGVGGAAAVYRAAHRNGRRVAIKLLHAELSGRDDVRRRFLREGYAANRIGHPGAVAVLDDDVADDGSVFLVLELLEGESIETRWSRKGQRLPVLEVLSIADQLLDVLAKAHAHGVIHRDIKPSNLFLTRDGAVKLLDFGIARACDGQTITLYENALGTPAFMPPEQALGHAGEIGPPTDLWAVGATMLTLLSGQHVHPASTAGELLLAAMTRRAAPTRAMLPNIPSDVACVIDKALRFKREDRWTDARQMQRAVRQAYFVARSATAPREQSTPPVSIDTLGIAKQLEVGRHLVAGTLIALPVALAITLVLSLMGPSGEPSAEGAQRADAERPASLVAADCPR